MTTSPRFQKPNFQFEVKRKSLKSKFEIQLYYYSNWK